MTKNRLRNFLLFTGLFALVASPASAHLTGDQHTHSGLASGIAHPLFGLDHLLAMVAVGLWAVQSGGRKLWALPAAFVSVMVLGGVMGMMGIGAPLVEQGIAASVLVLGLMVAAAVRLPMAASIGLVGAFAFFHGHAHGTELPAGATGAVYTMGFVAATAALHAAGIGMGLAAKKLAKSEAAQQRLVRAGGGLVTAAGALMIAGVL